MELYLKSTNFKAAEVKAFFDKNKSSIRDTTNLKEKIEFQKLRFDLYESFARKFNNEIDKIKFNNDKSFSDLEKIGVNMYSEFNIIEDSLFNTNVTSFRFKKDCSSISYKFTSFNRLSFRPCGEISG